MTTNSPWKPLFKIGDHLFQSGRQPGDHSYHLFGKKEKTPYKYITFYQLLSSDNQAEKTEMKADVYMIYRFFFI